MENVLANGISVVNELMTSSFLEREVKVDFYVPNGHSDKENYSLLLVNDGQDLITMNFKSILESFLESSPNTRIICVGIHCGPDRKNEYGTEGELDYKGRGDKAENYRRMIFDEMLPYIRKSTGIIEFKDKSFCGFSLGGLSALDIVWNHPEEFLNVGIFSGSLWWRNLCQDDPNYDDVEHRIMHLRIRKGKLYPWLRFFFESGTLDEIADRNNNGIIDAIDDTLALIEELKKLGYSENNIHYLEIPGGKHDVETWSKALPDFLKWCWG
ncbi:MAG: hypothetical protein NVS3B19_13560 [Ginsengibacter sp.]